MPEPLPTRQIKRVEPFEFDTSRREKWSEMEWWVKCVTQGTKIQLFPVPENYSHELWLNDATGIKLLGIISFPIVNGKVMVQPDFSNMSQHLRRPYSTVEMRLFQDVVRRYVMQPGFMIKENEPGYKKPAQGPEAETTLLHYVGE